MGWLEFFVLLFAAVSAVAAVVTVRQTSQALGRAERVAAEEERHRRLLQLGRAAEAARDIGRLASAQSVLQAIYAQAELAVALAALGPEPPLPKTRALSELAMDEDISADIAADAHEALLEIAEALGNQHPNRPAQASANL